MQRRADFRRVNGGQNLVRAFAERLRGSPQVPVELAAGGHERDRGADIVRYRGCLMLGGHQRKAEFASRPGDEFFAFKLLSEDVVQSDGLPRYSAASQHAQLAQYHHLLRARERERLERFLAQEGAGQVRRGPHGLPPRPRRVEAANAEMRLIEQDLPAVDFFGSPPLELTGKLVLTLLGVDNVGIFTQTADLSGQTCEHRQCFPVEAVESCLSDLFSGEPTFMVSYEFKTAEEYAKEHATFGEADKTLIVSSLAKCLGRARDFASYADITIKVDGIEFKAHMVVLAAQSEVFHAMFESNMCERSEGVLDLEDTNPEAVDAMLKYVYGRDVAGIQDDLMVAVDLLRLANKYNIEGLQGTCEKIIRTRDKEDVDMRTALHIFLCGYQLSFPELEEFAARLVKTKHAEILGSGSDLVFNDFMKANVDATRKLFYLISKCNN